MAHRRPKLSLCSPVFTLKSGRPVRTIDYETVNAALAEDANAPSLFRGMAQRLRDQPIPDDVTGLAARHAPALVATMRENVARISRHQTAGSLDTSKLVRLARPSSRAQFERDAATAFRARVPVLNNVPLKIAVVADMNWRIRGSDSRYVAKVGTLAFILSDAAAVAGLQCAAYGVRGHFRPDDCNPFPGARRKGAIISIFGAYGRRITPAAFATHASHHGYVAPFRYALDMGGGGSTNGTGGIDYAREHDGASFIVAIGEFDDQGKADVHLPADVTIEDAVAAAHAALAARQRVAA